MVTLEHTLRMLKIPIFDDGVVNLGETSLLLRAIRPYALRGDADARELTELLQKVRADGVITPGESERIRQVLDRITVGRVNERRERQFQQRLAGAAPGALPAGKRYRSADEYLRDTWRLAAAVRSSGWQPDILIALWRGGAPVGVAVHEFFKVTGWNVRHLPLKCASYTGIGENRGGVEIVHGDIVFGMLREGDKVRVVDDVFDTGKTAEAVKARIEATGAEMRMACVYWKPQKNATSLKPDYFVKDAGLDWIVFPHEIEGLSQDEIRTKDPVLADLLSENVV